MKVNLFSVYDSAAARYTEPWPAPTVELALRRFRHTANSEGNDISMFPEDYSLFHVGVFDQETGLLEEFETPRSLGVAITFKERGVTPVRIADSAEDAHGFVNEEEISHA